MPHIQTVTALESYRERCEDRVAAFTFEERTVIVVADGAGGVGSGDVAAECVLREIKAELNGIKRNRNTRLTLAKMISTTYK